MRLYVSMGRDGATCFLEAKAISIFCGYAEMHLVAAVARVPLIVVSYDLAELEAVARIIGAMQTADETPEVYFWDLEKEEAEVLIAFKTVLPSDELVRELSGMAGTIQEEMPFRTLGTLAEANASREKSALPFLSQFDRTGHAIIHVTEEDGDDLLAGSIGCFMTKKVYRQRPKLFA